MTAEALTNRSDQVSLSEDNHPTRRAWKLDGGIGGRGSGAVSASSQGCELGQVTCRPVLGAPLPKVGIMTAPTSKGLASSKLSDDVIPCDGSAGGGRASRTRPGVLARLHHSIHVPLGE